MNPFQLLSRGHIAHMSFFFAVCALLAACGGGGAGTSAGQSSGTPTASAVPTTMTVAEYAAATTSASSSATSGSSSQASNSQAFANAVNLLAVNQLQAALGETANSWFVDQISIPALTLDTVQSLRAAASGTTAIRVSDAIKVQGLPEGWLTALREARPGQQSQKVALNQAGKKFATQFLASVLGGQQWSGTQWDFSSAGGSVTPSYLEDAGFNYYPSLTQLVLADRTSVNANWISAGEPFMGVFELPTSDGPYRFHVPMLRHTSNVSRFSGSDYVAERVLLSNGLSLVSIRPNGDSNTFGRTRLGAAVAEALPKVFATDAQMSVLVLPAIEAKLYSNMQAEMERWGIGEALSERDADLSALDNKGGTYAAVASGVATLKLTASGLSLTQASSTAFIFSPLNPNGPEYGGGFTLVTPPTCSPQAETYSGSPDLSPFYLLLVSTEGQRIVAIATMASSVAAAGTHIAQPGCLILEPGL